MARTRRPRISRRLQELMDDVAEQDSVSLARWIKRNRIQLDPYTGWYRMSGIELVHALASGERGDFVILFNGPAGWVIGDNEGRTFAPCDDPLPPGARRHGRQVFFDSEDAAKLAADTLPGYWRDPTGEPNR